MSPDGRLANVLKLMDENKASKYVIFTDAAPGFPVRVAVGIREIGTFELEIPEDRYDGFKLMAIIDDLNKGPAKSVFLDSVAAQPA